MAFDGVAVALHEFKDHEPEPSVQFFGILGLPRDLMSAVAWLFVLYVHHVTASV